LRCALAAAEMGLIVPISSAEATIRAVARQTSLWRLPDHRRPRQPRGRSTGINDGENGEVQALMKGSLHRRAEPRS
jgi:hypothetical protein